MQRLYDNNQQKHNHMSDKFLDIYRIPSARAAWWDYRNDAAYFVTICTAGREHYFGEIVETTPKKEMQLSEIGQIAHQNWIKISEHFPFIRLDAFVVMPNHIHGIMIIGNLKIDGADVETGFVETGFKPVSTDCKLIFVFQTGTTKIMQ